MKPAFSSNSKKHTDIPFYRQCNRPPNCVSILPQREQKGVPQLRNKVDVTPIQPEDRIAALDVIRGVAVLGILIVNMAFFNSAHSYDAQFRAQNWPGAADSLVRWLIDVFFSGKFYTMFSFLFGIGMVIFLDRASQKGNPAVPLFLRRMTILLGIGAIHAFLIWYGDILVEYAVLGFVLVLFRKTSQKIVLGSALFLLLASPIFYVLNFFQYSQLIWKQMKWGMFFYAPGMMNLSEKAYAKGTYFDMVHQRYLDVMYGYSFAWWASFPVLLAMFLFGVYAVRKGVFHQPHVHRTFITRVWIGSLILAVIGGYLEQQRGLQVQSLWTLYFYRVGVRISDPAGCFFYVTSMLLLLQHSGWQRFFAPISFVGRMALSNYLLSSLICTTIFYNYGFGLYNQVGPAKGLTMSLLIYTLLVVFSIFWLRAFRFGPMEWVWRMLTYGKRPEMKRNEPAK